MEIIYTTEDLYIIINRLLRNKSKIDTYNFILINYRLEPDVLREFAYILIQDNIPHVIWITLSINQNLTENFIREFRDNIYSPGLLINDNIQEDLIDRINDIINWQESLWVYNYYTENKEEYLFPKLKYYLSKYNII